MEEKRQYDRLFNHLQKLSDINLDDLDHLLFTLWKTRTTGLRSAAKSHFQSLLRLASPSEIDPVLACLRLLIRKSVHDNFSGEDLLKLLPPNLPIELQTNLVLLLQKYQNLWRQEVSSEQGKASDFASFTSSQNSEISNWLHQYDYGASTPLIPDPAPVCLTSVPLQHDAAGPSNNPGALPRLKAMTWQLDNRGASHANRMAIIDLKLQDCTKSSMGEMEVKFQVTKDTLEAMLRSMTYINEQLSSSVGMHSGPVQKKQKL